MIHKETPVAVPAMNRMETTNLAKKYTYVYTCMVAIRYDSE